MPTTLLIIAFNLVPLAGMWLYDWQSFDLIFLYWMENVVIGAFTVLRMVVRPYSHVIEVVPLFFFAPFFTFHYGMFCYVHGLFIISLFGNDLPDSNNLLESAMLVLDTPGMLLALLSLVALQASDWLRDTVKQGLGSEGVKELMVAPYRRIVVLHVVIIGSGFALTALGDPWIGLVALVVVKTLSDLYHAQKDESAVNQPLTLTDEQLAEMHEKFAEPVVTVNGKEKRFASFADMKRSKEFRMMSGVMRMLGARDELRVMQTFIDEKIAQEQLDADSHSA